MKNKTKRILKQYRVSTTIVVAAIIVSLVFLTLPYAIADPLSYVTSFFAGFLITYEKRV